MMDGDSDDLDALTVEQLQEVYDSMFDAAGGAGVPDLERAPAFQAPEAARAACADLRARILAHNGIAVDLSHWTGAAPPLATETPIVAEETTPLDDLKTSSAAPAGEKVKTRRAAKDVGAAVENQKGDTTVSKAKTKRAISKKAPAPKKVVAGANGNGHGGKTGSKIATVAKLLRRASGCTSREVLDATGWPAVSMPAMAKACGLKLKKEKEKGKVTRYFGS